MQRVHSIPIRLHLLEMAKKDLFIGEVEPYLITERALLGKYILGLLNDKRSSALGHSCRPEKPECDVLIELSETLAKRSPSQPKLFRGLHEYLDNLFKEKLKTWSQSNHLYQVSSYKATVKFFEYYGLDTQNATFNSNYQHLLEYLRKLKR